MRTQKCIKAPRIGEVKQRRTRLKFGWATGGEFRKLIKARRALASKFEHNLLFALHRRNREELDPEVLESFRGDKAPL
jgi:hypothetical protein